MTNHMIVYTHVLIVLHNVHSCDSQLRPMTSRVNYNITNLYPYMTFKYITQPIIITFNDDITSENSSSTVIYLTLSSLVMPYEFMY